MKKNYILGILLIIVMVGCQKGDLPPEPGAPGVVGKAYAYYEGYAPPIDVFDGDKQIFFLDKYVFNLDPSEEYLSTKASVDHTGGYVYKYYYVYTNNRWEKQDFREETVKGSNWIRDSAIDYLSIKTNTIIPGDNYIVAYSCKKYDNRWRCGCSSKYGSCNQWMLNTFLYRNVELPPEPIEPGSIITMRLWISPRGEMIEKGKEIYLDVYFNSKRYDLEQLDDTIDVRMTKPDESEEWIQVERRGEVRCEEWQGEEAEESVEEEAVEEAEEERVEFSCHVGYYTEYTPDMLGEYLIDLGDVAVPENYKIETGYFKVVDKIEFEKYLILEDIGEFENRHYNAHYYGDNRMYFWINYLDKNFKWVGVSIHLPKKDLYVKDWQETEINGNTVYFREGSDEHGKWINYQWLSGNVRVEINSWSHEELPNIMPIVKAYLEKWPAVKESTEEGLVLSFPENFPDTFKENDKGIPISVKIENKGAFPQLEEINEFYAYLWTGGYDPVILKISPTTLRLDGKDIVSGQSYSANLKVDTYLLPPGMDYYIPNLGFTITYIYKTKLNQQICLDPGPRSDSSDDECRIKDPDIYTHFQGAPIAVKKIEEDVTMTDYLFKLFIENVGGGLVIPMEKINRNPYDSYGWEELNKVLIKQIKIGNMSMTECRPDVGEDVQLVDDKGYVFCRLDKSKSDDLAIYAELYAEFDYGYHTSISKKINITKNITTCTDSDATSQYPDGKNVYLKGITKWVSPDGTPLNALDYCSSGGGSQIFESWCCPGGSCYALETCPNGCEDGACICTNDLECGIGYFCRSGICSEAPRCEGADVIVDMREGETKTFTVNGKQYEVRLLGVNEYYNVKFEIDGVILETTKIGERYPLGDGGWIVADGLGPEKETGVFVVKVCLKGSRCTDSDGGKDYYVKGAGTLAQKHDDVCRYEKLLEHYCDGTGILEKNDYFFITASDTDRLLRYKGSDKCRPEIDPQAKFDIVETGKRVEVSIGSDGTFTLKLYEGSFDFKVLDCDEDDSAIKLIDTPYLREERYNCPNGCEDGGCLINETIEPVEENITNST